MRIVFMGTPDFAVPGLMALLKNGMDIIKVITQPDKPRMRGRKVLPSPIKQRAIACGLSVAEFEKISESDAALQIKAINPDAIVVIAYGQMLPPDILNIPHFGCINVHASLLPKYRGAAPMQWAIINGEKFTGVTTILMDEGMDTGDVLLQQAVPIADSDTAGNLHDKLSKIGATLLVDTLEGLKQNKVKPKPQDHSLATYAPMLKKEDGIIDWSLPADKINNVIRGMFPWPGAYTLFNGRPIRIIESEIVRVNSNAASGKIIDKIKNSGFVVQCGTDALLIKTVQIPGSKILSAQEYLSGHQLNIGDWLGRG